MNKPISYELAKLLKAEGYNQKDCRNYYLENGLLTTMPFTDYINGKTTGAAPTIAEVVMWLYEKHGIWIVSFPIEDGYWAFDIFDLESNCIKSGMEFNSPTEAYEAAIEYVLTKLI